MSLLIYLAILALDIVTIMDVLKNIKDSEKKILWIIVVIFLPLLGPVLYYVLGKK
ncbi:MAG: PLDc_N domain-containing protein [Bacteroidetes bacterium]|nr:PLDc_N domain-containing protein [Bacteroidota bacterium]